MQSFSELETWKHNPDFQEGWQETGAELSNYKSESQ